MSVRTDKDMNMNFLGLFSTNSHQIKAFIQRSLDVLISSTITHEPLTKESKNSIGALGKLMYKSLVHCNIVVTAKFLFLRKLSF